MRDRIDVIIKQVREYLKQENDEGLQNIFQISHPSDLAGVLERVGSQQSAELFARMPAGKKVEVLSLLAGAIAAALLEEIDDRETVKLISSMSPERAADIFLTFAPEQRERYLTLIKDEQFRRTLVDLISYPHDTAGGIMTTDFFAVDEKQPVEKTLEQLKETAVDQESVNYIYTLNEDHGLSGAVSLRRLLQADPWDELREYACRDLFKVLVDDDREKAARLINHYDLLALPVIDHQGRLCGVIRTSEAARIMESEFTEDLYRQFGLAPSRELETEYGMNPMRSSLWSDLGLRLPGLIIVCFALLAVAIVSGYFEAFLLEYIELVFFIPLVAALGSTAAAQTAVVFTRELSLEHFDISRFWSYLFKKTLGSGFILALFLALFSGLCIWVWQVYVRLSDPTGFAVLLAAVVSASVFIAMLVASLGGLLLPYIFYKLSADPANVSNPLLRGIFDLVAVVVYLVVALLVLNSF
ncbi:MAG: magnesium transporter [bacterium]